MDLMREIRKRKIPRVNLSFVMSKGEDRGIIYKGGKLLAGVGIRLKNFLLVLLSVVYVGVSTEWGKQTGSCIYNSGV
jgi:hypothetical protein